jgi:phosphate transport system permease protein
LFREVKNMNRRLKDAAANKFSFFVAVFSSLLIFIIALTLFQRSIPILQALSLSDLFLSSSWFPSKGQFGFYPFLIGTVYVTALAMTIAVPICILTAIYLAEYAPKKIRGGIIPLIDLLAGIPSVIVGLWGVLFVVPLIRYHIAPAAGVSATGYSLLAGGIVLAIMVSPIIISISEEVLRAVPFEVAEASFALGATKWQTVKHVVLRKALPGVVAATILGFSRAFGETMAVLMVLGNVAKVPTSLFDPAYTLPTLIANNYGEIMSVPLYDSALLLGALLLLVIVVFFNALARIVLLRAQRRSA